MKEWGPLRETEDMQDNMVNGICKSKGMKDTLKNRMWQSNDDDLEIAFALQIHLDSTEEVVLLQANLI